MRITIEITRTETVARRLEMLAPYFAPLLSFFMRPSAADEMDAIAAAAAVNGRRVPPCHVADCPGRDGLGCVHTSPQSNRC